MSPRSSPVQTAGRIGLLLSITINQIVTCSNRAGSINLFSWSRFQTADAKVLFDVACDRVLEHFKLRNLNYSQRISISLKKLAEGRYVFETQSTGTGSIITVEPR